jgi:hypothetical protein
MNKKLQVVMLPSNGEKDLQTRDSLYFYSAIDNLVKGFLNARSTKHVPQHLYFLSDEEIKEVDWCLYKKTVVGEQPFQMRKELLINKAWFKKIIATTDSSLLVEHKLPLMTQHLSLPQPSQSFLELYVKEYNKGNQIKEVLVEYEEIDSDKLYTPQEANLYPKLKINPKDNTINIKSVKNSFTRKDMLNAYAAGFNRAEWLYWNEYYQGHARPTEPLDINKFEQNL